MILIDKEKAIALHEMMARETGGGIGVRDEALLESALSSAFATFDGIDLYPTVEEKALLDEYRRMSTESKAVLVETAKHMR